MNTANELKTLADTAKIISDQIANLEEQLSDKKSTLKQLIEFDIPEKMRLMQVQEITLDNGLKIKVDGFVDARVKDEETAFQWLHSTGNDGVIKNTVTMNFNTQDSDLANRAVTVLIEAGLGHYVVNKKTIHPATLKKLVRESLEDEELSQSLPKEAFGVYEGKRAKITSNQ